MSQQGIAGMRRAGEDLLAVSRSLGEPEWGQPSAAKGWSVLDVVIHVGALLEFLQSAVAGEAAPDLGIEAINDIAVADRRDWDPARAVDNLDRQLSQAIPTFAALQEEPMASMQTQMVDLGTYPFHAIADMFSFDISTHLRYDVLAPRGPISHDVPPLDEVRLAPAVSWLLGGIPQMQLGLVDRLRAPLALRLTGPAAQTVLVAPVDGSIAVRSLEPDTDVVVATVTSTTEDLLAWSSTRIPWRELVSVEGDQAAAAEFLDALNLI